MKNGFGNVDEANMISVCKIDGHVFGVNSVNTHISHYGIYNLKGSDEYNHHFLKTYKHLGKLPFCLNPLGLNVT